MTDPLSFTRSLKQSNFLGLAFIEAIEYSVNAVKAVSVPEKKPDKHNKTINIKKSVI